MSKKFKPLSNPPSHSPLTSVPIASEQSGNTRGGALASDVPLSVLSVTTESAERDVTCYDPEAAQPAVEVAQAIELSDEQQSFIESVLTPSETNVLLLGKAGVGKSVTTRALLSLARDRGIAYLHGAPTGVAAINVGGQTIHSLINALRRASTPMIQFFLIDEVSMVRADLLDNLDSALRYAMRCPEKPFGGVKMVLVGDPGQLPPVMKKGDAESDYVKDNYLTPYFWSAAVYSQCQWQVIELTKIFRQKGEGFPRLLNYIRSGESEKPLKYLNGNRKTYEPKGVILTGTNKAAEEINALELFKLPGSPNRFDAEVSGKIQPHEYPAEVCLSLKIGAKVMVIKNIYRPAPHSEMDDQWHEDDDPESTQHRYKLELVNGDVGIVTAYGPGTVKMQCERTGQEHHIGKQTWIKEEKVYDPETKRMTSEEVAWFSQFPLRLAWAITIHKSQGATLQELTLDVRRPLFAAGQCYVALSRGVALDGIHIWGTLRKDDVMCCPDVIAFLRGYKAGVGVKKNSVHDAEWQEEQKKRVPSLQGGFAFAEEKVGNENDTKTFEDS